MALYKDLGQVQCVSFQAPPPLPSFIRDGVAGNLTCFALSFLTPVTIMGAVLFLLFALLYFGEAYQSAFGESLVDAIGSDRTGIDV